MVSAKARKFIALLALTLITATTFFASSTPASAATCQGQIGQGISPATPARAGSYFTDWSIDGDPSDSEYVFVFRPVWTVDGVDRLVWSASWPITSMANWRWGGTLGAKACIGNNQVQLYADTVAVNLSGGPDYWKNNISLFRY